MKKHLKISNAPTSWPIPRKGKTFVIKGNDKSVPITIILRDMLQFANTRKEVKNALHKKDVLISNKVVLDEKKLMELFDTLAILPSKKYYRLTLSEKGKFSIEEISEKDSKSKISKIIGKRTIKNKKIQLNLSDGRNYFSNLPCKVNDSALIDLDKNVISKILELKNNANVLVISGKHVGEKGKIISIYDTKKMAEIETKEGKHNVLIKQLMVIN